ncbi:hypothetical protein A4A49_40875 [Nicotiana attenuata]|uniref:Uncharacterized protein n=1 Tax=Nicotiana attenuata TaxID=49451 RepID=A0A1J6K364_NICAT|nr:hypothetical protein A4A49_40875 [Nicotiana attenuata]
MEERGENHERTNFNCKSKCHRIISYHWMLQSMCLKTPSAIFVKISLSVSCEEYLGDFPFRRSRTTLE